MSQRKQEGVRKHPASPPKPKFSKGASPALMPSDSERAPTWFCEFCNAYHRVKAKAVFCPMLGAKVYAPSSLKKPAKSPPDWIKEHSFIDTEFGVICEECGGSYDKLEMEAKAEVLR